MNGLGLLSLIVILGIIGMIIRILLDMNKQSSKIN